MRIFLFLPILLLFSSPLWGQKYVPGYVIHDQADTAYGLIREDQHYLWIKENKRAAPEKYKYKDLEGYQIGSHRFVPDCFEVIQNNFPERRCGFLEVLEEGAVSLYLYNGKNLYNNEKHPNYYVKRDSNPPFLVEKRKFAFKREMAQFFADHPEIPGKIKSGSYSHEDIKMIVAIYNEWKS